MTSDSIAAPVAEVKILMTGGFTPVLRELGPAFERASGHKLAITTATLGVLIKRVRDDESFDVVLSPRSAIDGLVKDGRISAGNVTVIASSDMAVAVRAGAARPDITTPGALKRTLLAARSIAYPDPHNAARNPALGVHLAGVINRLGITDELKSKTVFSKTVDIADLIARGEAEIGITQLQNFVRAGGIDIVGLLPGDLRHTVVFAAAVMTGAGGIDAAKALISFLLTPEAAAVISAAGMEPAVR